MERCKPQTTGIQPALNLECLRPYICAPNLRREVREGLRGIEETCTGPSRKDLYDAATVSGFSANGKTKGWQCSSPSGCSWNRSRACT